MTTLLELEAAISSDKFSHTRAGDRIYCGWTLIYHRAHTPTGVRLECAGESHIVDALLRSIRNTSPLSPTEPR